MLLQPSLNVTCMCISLSRLLVFPQTSFPPPSLLLLHIYSTTASTAVASFGFAATPKRESVMAPDQPYRSSSLLTGGKSLRILNRR